MNSNSDNRHNQTYFCPFQSECMRLFDEIDAYTKTSGWSGTGEIFTETTNDLQLEQLAQHLNVCPLCQAATASQRQARDKQRRLLRSLLVESESLVPSVVSNILIAIQREPVSSRATSFPVAPSEQEMSRAGNAITPLVPRNQRQRAKSSMSTLLALLVATVVIVLSFSLFWQYALHAAQSRTAISPLLSPTIRTSVTATPAQTAPLVNVVPASSLVVSSDNSWPSVLISRSAGDGQHYSAENYDTTSGKSLQVLQSCCDTNIAIDGVSHKGKDLVYHTWDGQKTYYHVLGGDIFSVTGRGSNAVWSTNDTVIYASTAHSLTVFDENTHQVQSVAISLGADNLVGYQENTPPQPNYLYFSRLESGGRSLFRIATNQLTPTTTVEGPLASASPSSLFWFGLDGMHNNGVYYMMNKNLYYTNLSTRMPLLISNDAVPVGYNSAGGDSLMYIQETSTGIFQLKNANDNTTLFDDIAPGAVALCDGTPPSDRIPICDDGIAVNPYNTMLLLVARSVGGAYQVLQVDWQQQPQPTNIDTTSPFHFIGWDKWI